MSIYKGNNIVSAIYKGGTPINKIYKGTNLVFGGGTPSINNNLDFTFDDSTPLVFNYNGSPYTASTSPQSIDIVSSVGEFTSAYQMFKDQSNLLTVGNVPDNSNVSTFQSMFQNCENLTYVNCKDWNTSNVEYLNGMFYNCTSLTSLDVSNWDISKVSNGQYMFNYCTSLSQITCKQEFKDWCRTNKDTIGLDNFDSITWIIIDREYVMLTRDTEKDIPIRTFRFEMTETSNPGNTFVALSSEPSQTSTGALSGPCSLYGFSFSLAENRIFDDGAVLEIEDMTLVDADNSIYEYTFSTTVYICDIQTNVPIGKIWYYPD